MKTYRVSIIVERYYDTLHAGHRNIARNERGEWYSKSYVRSRSSEGTCLPEVRETLGKVDYQIEAEQLLVVDGVPPDVDGELACAAVSRG